MPGFAEWPAAPFHFGVPVRTLGGAKEDTRLTDDVTAQYEAYPYPERDPRDEARRLITGSPSLPQEMDHHLWGGARDWSRPLRFLVAGGGTGDGLVQLCQLLTSAGCPFEATYVDLSANARRVAEARIAARKLTNVRFVTGSLLDAASLGTFDYIDCCGVLHHLPEPQDGFDALGRALAPGGGMGLMVYAPLGRLGVYPLQSAFAALTRNCTPQDRLRVARSVFARLPEDHPFLGNPHLVDHKVSDAGFYDLLLHSRDRPYTISQLLDALSHAGLELAGVPEPVLYDPAAFLEGAEPAEPLSQTERMQLAENLRGSLKTHVVYAVRLGDRIKPPLGHPRAVPRLRGIAPAKLARVIAQSGALKLSTGGQKREVRVPKASSFVVGQIDGRRDLGQIRGLLGWDQFAFNAAWSPVEKALTGYGLLHYSRV